MFFSTAYYPLVLVGPVVMLCGVIVLILSVEVCQRVKKSDVSKSKSKELIANEVLPEDDIDHLKKVIKACKKSNK